VAEAKSATAFRTISEVSDDIGVPQHVLRFWETKFPAVKPLKRGGNRRYYRPEDVQLLEAINRLLYTEGYTIKGVQKLLQERGARGLVGLAEGGETIVPASAADLFEPEQPAETGGLAPHLSELRAIRDRLSQALAQSRTA
jgi:DNA-binding transcriptional MerR regulator